MYQYNYRIHDHYGQSKTDRKQLLRLVDWIITTPPALEAEFKQAMITIEQEHKMSYVTTFEREGRQEGEASLLARLLARKFGPLPAEIQKRLKTATLSQLETWSLNILDADSLDNVFTD